MSDARAPGRAQVGVGTLILLIAMLLVATAAAGVFFEVTDAFSGEVEAVGEDTSAEVTTQLEVVAASGRVVDGTVEEVNLTVKQGSDAGTTDLREATIQWVGPNGAATLTWAGGGGGGPTFGVTPVRDPDGSGRVLTSDDDRTVLTVDTGTAFNATTTVDGTVVDIVEVGPALEPGESVQATIITDGERQYRLTVPLRLTGDSTEL